MLKKVVLKYSAKAPGNNKRSRNKTLGEVEVHGYILNNTRTLRTYAYLTFPVELNGKEEVIITVKDRQAQ